MLLPLVLLCCTGVSDDSNLPLWWDIRIIPKFWRINWSDWGGSCASVFLKNSLSVMQGPELLPWSKKSTEVMSRRFSSLQILLVFILAEELVGVGVYMGIFFPPRRSFEFSQCHSNSYQSNMIFQQISWRREIFFTATVWQCFRSAWLVSIKTRTSLILDLIL